MFNIEQAAVLPVEEFQQQQVKDSTKKRKEFEDVPENIPSTEEIVEGTEEGK